MINLAWLAALALYALALLILHGRSRTDRPAHLRVIPLYQRLRALQSRAVETDTPLHLSLGSRSVLAAAPEIAQATALAHSVAQATGTAAHPLLVTSGEPSLFTASAAVANFAKSHAVASGDALRPDAVRVALVGAEPVSYASGGWEVAANHRLAGQVCFGPFGPEGLLLLEGAHRDTLERLSGSAELDAAALLALGATATAVGEDVYAASAYVRQPAQRAGLALQDGVRLLLLLGILIGLGLRLAGVWGG